MTNPTVFKFNVGGTRYEASQSLVNSFPNTLLAKSASKQWNEDPNAEIFIERDGSRFRYVLDCMRDGRVSLPVGVSKDAVLEDLKYYGFENIKEDNVATKVDAQTVLLGEEFLANLKDTAAIMNAFCEQRKLILRMEKARQGKLFKNCNELLKFAGLCVEKEEYDGSAGFYRVTLKLV